MKRVVLLGLLSLPAMSMAGVTALNAMPVADVLGHREALYGYTASGAQGTRRYEHAHGLELGLFERFELGFDNDFMGNTVWNLKFNLIEGPQAVSVGLMNLKDGEQADWFAVGRYDLSGVRLHGGYMRSGGVNRGMFGVDFELAPGMVIMAEHIAGPGEYSWLGFSYGISSVPGLSIGAAVGRPNTSSDGTVHFVTATYGFRF